MKPPIITINGEEFVLISKADFDRLVGGPNGRVDAVPFAMKSIGGSLRKAREAQGFTQADLARRLERPQSFVNEAEIGTARVGRRYIKAVLKACRLPKNWEG